MPLSTGGKSNLLQNLRAKSRLFPPLSSTAWTRRIYGKYTCLAHAYGKPKKSSDIDICVVIRDAADRPSAYLKIAMNLTNNHIAPCDLVVCRESDFYGSENPNGIEHTIMEEGKLLYAG